MSEQLVSYAIGRALVESLAWLVMVIDDADDDVIDPDAAARWQEDAGILLDHLSAPDRRSLAVLCRTLAEDPTIDPPMQRALLLLIRGFDLDNEVFSARLNRSRGA